MADHRRAPTLRTVNATCNSHTETLDQHTRTLDQHTQTLNQHTLALAGIDTKITAVTESCRRIEAYASQLPQIAKHVRDIRNVQADHTSVLEWIATTLGLRIARENTLDRAEDMV